MRSFPSLLLITGEPADKPSAFLDQLELSLKNGVKLVQIRAKSLSTMQFQILSLAAVKLCHDYDAMAILNSHMTLVHETRADGVHLSSEQLMQTSKRPFPKDIVISAACHNEAQIQHAANMDVDFVTISPIFTTPSSPLGKPLGWDGFTKLAKLSNLPCYALGGLTLEHLPTAKQHGAQGIAAIRALWGHALSQNLESPHHEMILEEKSEHEAITWNEEIIGDLNKIKK